MAKPTAATAIAVIGMACRFAGADDVEEYWQNLVDAVECVSQDPGSDPLDGPTAGRRFIRAVAKVRDVELFDADYFGVPPAEAAITDPQHRVMLEVAVAALEDAGYAGHHDGIVGVFAGCGDNQYLRDFVLPSEGHRGGDLDVRVMAANEKDFLAPRIAFKLGLTGPSVTVQTTCATSLSAVALACNALAAGDCDIALAGGVSLLMPDVEGYVYAPGGILSADGHCRTFDEAASGTVPAAGAALVVLKRDDEATADGDHRRAVIRGWAINNDGGSRAGFTTPNVAGQEAVIRTALTRSGVRADDVGYIEAHGTATPIGDPIEFEALRRIFATGTRAERTCVLGAVKPNIGHTDAASGVAGLIKAALAVERARIPATLHFRAPNPEIRLSGTPFQVTAETLRWQSDGLRTAGVSAFGLGGTNAHVVLQEPIPAPVPEAVRPRPVIAVSARTEAELAEMRARLADWVHRQASLTTAELADVAFTLAVGRPHFEYRWATAAEDLTALAENLSAPAGPPRRTARWALGIHGAPEEQAAMGRRQLVEEPLLRTALSDFTPLDGLDSRSDLHVAALSVLAVARVLLQLGLDFGRIDAPAWARPIVRWFLSGADRDTMEAALECCGTDADPGTARAGTGRLLVSPDFDLSRAVADAWAEGARIDWRHYYAGEARRRVPLPTYPFARRRFWLERENQIDGAAEPAHRHAGVPSADPTEVLTNVAAVWQNVLGLEAIDPDADFIEDLSGDSMYGVEIGARLSEIFQIELPIDLPFIAPTVAAAARYVTESLDSRTVAR